MPLRQIFERRGAAAVVGAKSSEVNHNGYAHGDSNLPVLNVKALQVVDDRGEVRIQLACTPEGQAQVSIMSTDGETRIGLVVDRSNGPSVILRDHAQNRIQLLVDRSGMATGILLSDPASHFAPWDLEDHPGVRDLLLCHSVCRTMVLKGATPGEKIKTSLRLDRLAQTTSPRERRGVRLPIGRCALSAALNRRL